MELGLSDCKDKILTINRASYLGCMKFIRKLANFAFEVSVSSIAGVYPSFQNLCISQARMRPETNIQ